MDSDLPQIKEIPDKVNFQAKLDMTSLDQFLRDMESVQICLDSMDATHQQMNANPGSQNQQQR